MNMQPISHDEKLLLSHKRTDRHKVTKTDLADIKALAGTTTTPTKTRKEGQSTEKANYVERIERGRYDTMY